MRFTLVPLQLYLVRVDVRRLPRGLVQVELLVPEEENGAVVVLVGGDVQARAALAHQGHDVLGGERASERKCILLGDIAFVGLKKV